MHQMSDWIFFRF